MKTEYVLYWEKKVTLYNKACGTYNLSPGNFNILTGYIPAKYLYLHVITVYLYNTTKVVEFQIVSKIKQKRGQRSKIK